jgi:hypothetical protein
VEQVLDKAVVFFHHSARMHRRSATSCGDYADGLAVRNALGAFDVATDACRLQVHTPPPFTPHPSPFDLKPQNRQPPTCKRAPQVELDLDFDAHVNTRTRRFKDRAVERRLVAALAEAAGVRQERVLVAGLMRGSVIVDALVQRDSTGSDYRSPEALGARVAQCIADKALALCQRFRAKSVRVVPADDSWWRTVSRLAAPGDGAGRGGARVSVRMHFEGVLFDDLQGFAELGGNSLADASTVKALQVTVTPVGSGNSVLGSQDTSSRVARFRPRVTDN